MAGYSEFAVIVAFVHLYTLFMVVPIFNSMLRIDKSLLEAATILVLLLGRCLQM